MSDLEFGEIQYSYNNSNVQNLAAALLQQSTSYISLLQNNIFLFNLAAAITV